MKKEVLRRYKDLHSDNPQNIRPALTPKSKKNNNDWLSDYWLKEQYNRNRPFNEQVQTKDELDKALKTSLKNHKSLIFERNPDTGEIYKRNYLEYDKRKKVLTKKEKVSHPNHYGGKDNPYEAIKVIEAWDLNFNLGNVVKYIARAGKKENTREDLEKAAWYIKRELKNL